LSIAYISQALKDHGELVAAEPGHGVGQTNEPGHSRGEHLQQLIARFMAERSAWLNQGRNPLVGAEVIQLSPGPGEREQRQKRSVETARRQPEHTGPARLLAEGLRRPHGSGERIRKRVSEQVQASRRAA